MMTSNYAHIRQIQPPHYPVSISIHPPYWYGKVRRHYPPLCPTSVAMMTGPIDEFNRLFDELLARLDPAKVFADLGETAVLLCYETHNVCCHRRRVAEWLETALGIVIPEMGFDRSETLPYHQQPLKKKVAKPARKKRGDTIPCFLFSW